MNIKGKGHSLTLVQGHSDSTFSNFCFLETAWVMLPPLKSPVLRKYSNPFKRPGMYPSISKCNAKRCNCCMHLCTNSTVTSSVNGRKISAVNNSDLDWKSIDLIYVLTWKTKNCNMQYVGQTCCALQKRFREHYRRMKKPKPIDTFLYQHFKLTGHSPNDVVMQPVEKLLGSSPVFLLRSPVFFRGTEQLAFSLLIITSGGTGNSGERSRSQMRAGFVFDTLTGYVSGVETGNVTQKSTCSHAMRIMEEASWSGQVWRRTGAPTSLLFQEYWPDNATSRRSYVLMWCLSYAQWATMASSKMTTQGRIGQELSTEFCKLTMWGV